MEQIIDPNAVLIGQTTICEAARLIAGNEYSQNVYSLSEFCALTEAIVLHDVLFTLPAELTSDVNDLALRNRLINAGILKEYASPVLTKEVIPLLAKWISREEQAKKAAAERNVDDPREIALLLEYVLNKLVDRNSNDLLKIAKDLTPTIRTFVTIYEG